MSRSREVVIGLCPYGILSFCLYILLVGEPPIDEDGDTENRLRRKALETPEPLSLIII